VTLGDATDLVESFAATLAGATGPSEEPFFLA
jgi:hypothetical protein